MKRLRDATVKCQEYLDDKKELLTSDLYNTMSLNVKEAHDAIDDESLTLCKIQYSYQTTVVVPFTNADDDADADYKILNTTRVAICIPDEIERGSVSHLIQNMCIYKKHWLDWKLPHSIHGEKGDLFVIRQMEEIGHVFPP